MVFPGKALVGAAAAGTFLAFAGFPKWTAGLMSLFGFLGLGGWEYIKLVYRTLPRDLW